MTEWRLKIFAYLHDPPDKPLALGRDRGHAAWGHDLACRLVEKPSDQDWSRWKDLIARADRLASGADRSGLLQRRRPSLDELRHPLSGQPIDLSWARPNPEAAARALDEEFTALEPLKDESEAAFLALWGLLPLRLRARRGREELGGLWDLLPAETRMPNHPVAAHQVLVSALATVLAESDEALLLSFSVGPVQRFIGQARRLSDLWAGSALLSRALLQATLPIVEELGPDHFVFPVLRRSHLFLQEWLAADESVPRRCRYADRLRQLMPKAILHGGTPPGCLPNRFLAIVPAGRGQELASACEQRLRQWWEDVVCDKAAWFEHCGSGPTGFAAMAREQSRGSLRVAWAATPWPMADSALEGNAAARAAWLLGGALPAATKHHLAAAQAVREAAKAAPRPAAGEPGSRPATAFTPNGGVLYGPCYDTVERLLRPRRSPPPRSRSGCSRC